MRRAFFGIPWWTRCITPCQILAGELTDWYFLFRLAAWFFRELKDVFALMQANSPHEYIPRPDRDTRIRDEDWYPSTIGRCTIRGLIREFETCLTSPLTHSPPST